MNAIPREILALALVVLCGIPGARGQTLLTPAPGSTLAGASATLTWSAGAGASQYWIYVGRSAGAADIRNSGSLGTALAYTVPGLPTDGSTIHVRLWWLASAGWLWRDYTYVAARVEVVPPRMASPVPGTTLSGAAVTFTWTAGTDANQYWLQVGSSRGGVDRFNASTGMSTSQAVSGLPTDGTAVHVRLWWLTASGWLYSDQAYTAAALLRREEPAQMTSPAPGSRLDASTVTFAWGEGVGVSQYWLYLGTVRGALDLHSGSTGAGRSATVQVPQDGSTVHVRLWSSMSSGWAYVDYTYTTQQVTTSVRPEMMDPAPGSRLAASSGTFSWSAGTDVQEFWLYLGSTAGGYDLHNSGSLRTSTSRLVTGLPSDGRALHARLWYRLSAGWRWIDYGYTAATAAVGAQVIQPLEVIRQDLSAPGESDVYEFAAVSGLRYELRTQLAGLADSVLVLHDLSGNQLAENDDYGSDFSSRISWTCPTTGTYRVTVRAYGSSQTGGYSLRLRDNSPTSVALESFLGGSLDQIREEILQDYAVYHEKPIFTANADLAFILELMGLAVSFDVADIVGVTPEGRQGWVTCWATVSFGLATEWFPFGISVFQQEFTDDRQDPIPGTVSLELLTADAIVFHVTGWTYDSSDGGSSGDGMTGFTTNFGATAFSINLTVSAEIRKDVLAAALLAAAAARGTTTMSATDLSGIAVGLTQALFTVDASGVRELRVQKREVTRRDDGTN